MQLKHRVTMPARTQVPNSPFLYAVTRTTCEAGSGRTSDASGGCICPEGTVSFSSSGACMSTGLIAAAILLPVAALAAAAWLARRLFRQPTEEEAEELKRAVLMLRRRLRLTRREGVVVTSDWLPVWGHQASPVVVVQLTSLVTPSSIMIPIQFDSVPKTHLYPFNAVTDCFWY